MQNHAPRRAGRNSDDTGDISFNPAGGDLGLRSGQHYDPRGFEDYRVEPTDQQSYDPRAYAPNPDEPYGYDAEGQPLYYDPNHESQRPARSGFIIVVGVLAVALLGGAGALAYRMAGQGGVLSGEPPLIKADVQPSKTVPEPTVATADTSHNKQIYERAGVNPAQKSKVVSREEEPVDLPASAPPVVNTDSARVILPGGPASVEPVAPTTMGSEPRRVKTVEIRPDSSYDAPTSPRREADPIAQLAATDQAPARASGEFDNGIMSDGAPQQAPRARPAAPSAARPQAAPQPAQAAPAPPAQQALRPVAPPAPARPAQPAAAPQPRDQQVATAAVPRAAPPATPAAGRATPGGGFVVQVTSQRSDADARSAYSALQRKFPQVLGGYSANIQAANVGDRGTYYRVRVGPFADGAQASTVCSNLRAAGGDCVVSRN